jgi:hypothetical protein
MNEAFQARRITEDLAILDASWEPKEAFHAVADYYGKQPAGR